MEKTKKAPKIQNGEKKEPTRAELIKQVEQKIERTKNDFHYWSGYLACLKEIK
tara:strand:- start:459 stop:617 length:159 start_codon:yes stop_codon:yes gene_type:complete